MPSKSGLLLVIAVHLVILSALVLSGCASAVPSATGLRPPEASLMTPPPPAPTVKAGDDLRVEYLKLRRIYGSETGRLRHLQRYVRTAVGRQ